MWRSFGRHGLITLAVPQRFAALRVNRPVLRPDTKRVSRASIPSRDPSAPPSLRLRDVAEAAPVESASGNPAAPPVASNWNDAALRSKIILLVLLAVAGGVAVGIVESHLNHSYWPLFLGFTLVAVPLICLGVCWACQPIEQILGELDGAEATDRSDVIARLPLERHDEVGRLARIMHRYSIDATRDQNDAKQLRRTLDDSIQRATKVATRNLTEMAMRDALTALGNRRFLDEHLPALFESCRRSDTDLVCVAIDIDCFKKLNDTLGHGAGDELLRTLGQLILSLIRHEDYAVRLGGDEFLILMPGCPLSRVRQVADQLYALFRQHTRVVVRGDTKPDLSMGASSLRRDAAATPQDLIKRADEYLYKSKRAGKGRLTGA